MSQKARLLKMFEEGRVLTNYELRDMRPAMFQYPVRINELRKEGYDIRGWFDPNDKKKYYYKLVARADEKGQFILT